MSRQQMRAPRSSRWSTRTVGDVSVKTLGTAPDLGPVIDAIRSDGDLIQAISSVGGAAHTHHAVVIQGPATLIAWVDMVRSYPLFYRTEGSPEVSDDPWELFERWDPSDADEEAVLGVAMAGYALGSRTLHRAVKQLRVGEALVVRGDQIETHRYYSYRPQPSGAGITEAGIGEVLDAAFDDLVARSRGARLWVPLSGGWDSRLVLAKLAERNYEPLTAFTYGTPHSHEAGVAEAVAGALGVPWVHIPADGKALALPSEQERRRAYWVDAARLTSVPTMSEYLGLTQLVAQGQVTQEDVIVNGQSGDFISGGHLPAHLRPGTGVSEEILIDALMAKHLVLWRHLMTPENERRIRAQVFDEIASGFGEELHEDNIAWAYESWECHERQAKYVVNGQRLYDHLGLRWELPLWDGRFMRLWESATFDQKVNQSLFLRYLQTYDYKAVFSSIPRATWTWPRHLAWVVPAARAIGALRGGRAKDAYYARMMYHGRFKDQWQMYGIETYRKNVGDMRNPVSLYARTMLEELDVPWPGTKEP